MADDVGPVKRLIEAARAVLTPNYPANADTLIDEHIALRDALAACEGIEEHQSWETRTEAGFPKTGRTRWTATTPWLPDPQGEEG